MSRQGPTGLRFWVRGLMPGLLIAIGLVHTLVGILGGGKTLLAIFREGMWDAIHSRATTPDRELLVWFLVSGSLLVMLGHLGYWVERHMGCALPAFLGAELVTIGLLLAVVSGGSLPPILIAFGGVYSILVSRSMRRRQPEITP